MVGAWLNIEGGEWRVESGAFAQPAGLPRAAFLPRFAKPRKVRPREQLQEGVALSV